MNNDNNNQDQNNKTHEAMEKFLHEQMEEELNATPTQEENEPEDHAGIQSPMDPENANMQTPPKGRMAPIKFFIGATTTIALMIAGFLGYSSYKNPDIFKAAIVDVNDSTPSNAEVVYIPSHTGGAGEEGNILVKVRDDITSFDSITFALNYSPVDSLVFDQNPIVFDSTTVIQSAAFQMAAESEPGKLLVTIILNSPLTIDVTDPSDYSTHQTLFKLATQINPTAAQGQVIQLSGSDLAVLNGTNAVDVGDFATGTITVQGQDELKVLNAEVIDSTHVAVHFSDYLSDVGLAADYFSGVLGAATAVESGSLYGYDQKTAVITTASQTAGTRYILTVGSSVTGNTQGSVNSSYQSVIFYGYGATTGVLSDFSMTSTNVSDYRTFTVNLSDAVSPGSVAATDFFLQDMTNSASVTLNTVTASGSQLNFTTVQPLLKRNTYLLTTVGDIVRQSDGASLGINRIAFTGYKNGPRITSATISRSPYEPYTYSAVITFDENVQATGSSFGHLYTTGDSSETAINSSSTYSPNISSNSLTLTNPIFNNSGSNFTFSVSSVSDITNSSNVPVDEANKTITFWGYAYDVNRILGGVSITGKNSFTIAQGNTTLAGVDVADVSVLTYTGAGAVTTHTVTSVSYSSSALSITLNSNLDPSLRYVVRISDGTPADSVLGATSFTPNQNLTVMSAQATGVRQVRVTFSDNIDGDGVAYNDFSISGGINTIASGFQIEPDFQHIRISTDADLDPGTIYTITASDIYAYGSAGLIGKNIAVFGGYGTVAAKSSVSLSSVDVNSGTSLRLHFSSSVDASTMTPVNMRIASISGGAETALTITNITQVDSSTFDITTAKQTAGTNYFVSFNGVKDLSGLLIGNSSVKNFMGFELPEMIITTVVPGTVITGQGDTITLTGQNLDIVSLVRVGNQEVNILNQSTTSLSISLPDTISAGNYSIVLVNSQDETKTFSNVLLVTDSTQPTQVISSQSKAIPYSTPNDAVTQTTLWVLVEDSQGLSNISSVIVNLSQIGGVASQEMTKDLGAQPQNRQWYTHTLTIPSTVATSTTPYLLPVEVRKGTEVVSGTVSLMVTKDVQKSVAPEINQLYVSPVSVSPDGETPVKVSVQVSDQDGAATISSVVADLGALGIGFVPLAPMDSAEVSSELTTRFYQSEEFTVPDTVQTGAYTINVTALDATGESATLSATLNVSTELTGPTIQKSYLAPRKSIPNDGTTTFSIHAFVNDPDTVANITSVVVDFGTLGLAPAVLLKGFDTDTEAKSAWYSLEGMTIPKTSPVGVHQIEIMATDKNGGTSNSVLQIDVTQKDTLGDPPRIMENRAYTTPRVGVNDGTTPMTLYVFVRDDDDDIESVVVNLAPIGQVGVKTNDLAESGGSSSSASVASSGACPTGSNVLVCMNPSIKEGDAGQWFILPNVVVDTSTTASSEPYLLDVIATDSGGKSVQGKIAVSVNDGEAITNDKNPPQVLSAVATSSTTVEILFNEEIAASSVSRDGREFKITAQDNTNDVLEIVSASMNAAGNVVILSTSNQVKGKSYVASATSAVRDAVGVALVAGANNRASFKGFSVSGKVPQVAYVTATNTDEVEVEFKFPLKPSSLGEDSIRIFEADTTKPLDVLGVSFSDSASILKIKTGTQATSRRYRIQMNDIASYDGKTSDAGITATFKGYNIRIVQRQAATNLADLDGNGKVDFSDFTIFSSVYGTSYLNSGEGSEDEDYPGQPITSTPDSLVPHTSEPAGGEIIN